MPSPTSTARLPAASQDLDGACGLQTARKAQHIYSSAHVQMVRVGLQDGGG